MEYVKEFMTEITFWDVYEREQDRDNGEKNGKKGKKKMLWLKFTSLEY